MDEHYKNWSEGHNNLKFNFFAPMPGLIQAISFVKNNTWEIQVKSKTESRKGRIETYEVDTAYVVNEYGKEFADYVYKIQYLQRISTMFHQKKLSFLIRN